MSITLNYFVKETCKFMLSASAEIEYEEDKSYNFNLQIVNPRTKNTLSYKDIILENGNGIVEIDFDHSAYKEDGISIDVTAKITELPPPGPQPDLASHPGTESVPANTKNRIIETKCEKYRLFGLYACLDHIDFQYSLTYRQQAAYLTLQPLKALVDISLKEDYCLLSIVEDSVVLTYLSTFSEAVTPKWDINIIGKWITFQTNSQDRVMTGDFSRFYFEAAGLILHKPSGLMLQLPLILDNR